MLKRRLTLHIQASISDKRVYNSFCKAELHAGAVEVHITRNDQQPYSKPQTFPTLGFTALKICTEVAAILLQLAA